MKRIPTSSLLLLCLAAPLAAQGEQDLKITAKKGSSVWIQQESKTESNIDLGGQTMEQSMATTYVVQVTVKEVDEKGQVVVEAKCARVFGTATLPMIGDIEYDSLDQKADGKADEGDDGMGMGMPNPDAIGKGLTSIAGQSFVAKLDAYGNVVSMDGVEKALEAARTKAGKMGAQMLGAQLNDKNFERLVEAAFGTRPNKPIKVGDSWDQNEEQKTSRMDMNNKMKLTLAKADAESFEITADGTVEKAAGEAKKDADGKEAKKDEGEDDETHAMMKEMMANLKISNGKIKGSQKVSRTDGFVIASDSTMSMVLSMPSPMGGGEMTIDQKMVTTTKRTTEADGMKKGGGAKPALKDAEPAKGGK